MRKKGPFVKSSKDRRLERSTQLDQELVLLLPRPTAFLAWSRSDSFDLSSPVSLSPAFCESDLVESGWRVAAALSRFSFAFSPYPFCESGLRAEPAY